MLTAAILAALRCGGHLPAGRRRHRADVPAGRCGVPRTVAPSSHERLLSPAHPRSPLAGTDEERVVNALNVPGPGRRGSLTVAAGLAAAVAGATAPDAQAAAAAPGSSL